MVNNAMVVKEDINTFRILEKIYYEGYRRINLKGKHITIDEFRINY